MTAPSQRLLIVDDEPDFCASLSDVLSEWGYRVDVAHGAREALALARQHDYAAALLDYRMPEMNGVELSRELKALGQGATPIMLSAFATESTIAEASIAGATHFVTKPVDFDKLLPLVRQVSGRG